MSLNQILRPHPLLTIRHVSRKLHRTIELKSRRAISDMT
ncbi:hypothetical protein CCACVL1_16580 [Corchorus capsularis]|uniref:Uncharacterized protein n=1 Tax=Corchorus capsularis TaxID=210143 RepID=A0A1R3HWK2_COCAP|nr:hypothetical protein CCACVL1_16580 [Corchorus capsularis]